MIIVNKNTIIILVVDKDYRNQGVGTKLLEKCEKTIIDNGTLALQAKKHLDEYGKGDRVELPLIGVTDK